MITFDDKVSRPLQINLDDSLSQETTGENLMLQSEKEPKLGKFYINRILYLEEQKSMWRFTPDQ